MKTYKIIRTTHSVESDLDIKNILLFNYRTKKILEKHDMKPYYINTKLCVTADEDIVAEFLLVNDLDFKMVAVE